MKSTDSEPRFIEPGDDQDECLALLLYVTRQVDDEIRILKTIRRSLVKRVASRTNVGKCAC